LITNNFVDINLQVLVQHIIEE